MAGFIENLLRDSVGSFFGSDYLRDYTHAAKTFRTNSYQYAPKHKFLFHVYFDINSSAYSRGLSTGTNFGLGVKTVKLPNYSFDTHIMNQYNRKRIVQTKIKYDDIDISFHDDNGNMIRNLWYNYYTYYYNDASTQAIQNGLASTGNNPSAATGSNVGYNTRNLYKNSITDDASWGYIGEASVPTATAADQLIGQSKIPFFKNITVFGFNQHTFSAYSLINPIITRFGHDTYSYAEGQGVMENTMSIGYETVKYYDGALDGRKPGDIVTGFGADANYDRTLSPISVPGSQGTILGQGGLVDAAGGFAKAIDEGNILNAIKIAGTAYNTFKNINLKQTAASEVLGTIRNSVQGTPNRNVQFQFPTFGSSPSSTGTAGAANGTLSRPPTVR